MTTDQQPSAQDEKLNGLLTKFDDAVRLLTQAPTFSKPAKLPRVLDTARRLLMQDGAVRRLKHARLILNPQAYLKAPTGQHRNI